MPSNVGLVDQLNVPYSDTSRFPVTASSAPASYTDRSGTITTGGTAQNAMAANASRRALYFQNNSAGDMRISFTGTASITAGIKIVAGAYWEPPVGSIPSGALSVWGATTGQAWEAGEA